MPSDRLIPRRPGRYLRDADVLHAAVVTLLAVLLSAGVVWLGYVIHTWRIAARSSVTLPGRMVVLLFGRQLAGGVPDADYRGRLARALALARADRVERLLLLGGCTGEASSEAAVGQRWLAAHGLPANVPVELEQESVDSLENLAHARRLLGQAGPLPQVALITSRYHLARCQLLARRLGFDSRPVAAEDELPRDRRYLGRLLLEASYLMWIDLGLRWAGLIGHRRMVARVS